MRAAIVAAAALAAGFFFAMGLPERAMRRRGAGIVAFEKAGTWARAEEILDGWGEPGASAARTSIALDWAFIAAYVAFSALVAAEHGGWAWVPAVAVAIAGACDVGENAAMLRTLSRDRSRDWPGLARRLASTKFALVYPGLVASVVFLVRSL